MCFYSNRYRYTCGCITPSNFERQCAFKLDLVVRIGINARCADMNPVMYSPGCCPAHVEAARQEFARQAEFVRQEAVRQAASEAARRKA